MPKTRLFYEVSPLKAGASRTSVFTYHSDQRLSSGQLVSVLLGPRRSAAVVLRSTAKPTFPTKPVDKIFETVVPKHLFHLAEWMSSYYAAPVAKVWQTILPSNPQTKSRPRPDQESGIRNQEVDRVQLQDQQKAAIKKITAGEASNYLLHGATGSGKTQVYIELVKSAFKKGLSAIVLVPEISLTPQLNQNFRAEFGDAVVLTHSGMSDAERRLAWQACLNSKRPVVVLGPRSALFSPLLNLGFIIIDECHETTYKQEQAPRYHAADVAAKLAELTKCKLVQGSATPSAADIYMHQQKQLEMVKMPKPVYQNVAKPPQIIDLGDKSQLKASRFLSEPLLRAIAETLERDKQTILFINRRGSARLALCGNCDWVATCPNCHIPLTFHADVGLLRCHWCDYHTKPVPKCPSCAKYDIHYLGGGTKRVEIEVKRLFPRAVTTRLDRDSFDPKNINQLYDQLKDGKIDILIGTQMITKGLDLPGVETIGIVMADTMLYLPDFTAAERTFQLLYQVRGRAGRREGTPAQTVIQTYSARHPAILAVASGDYEKFINDQLKERELLKYPPFVSLLKLDCTRASRESAQKAAEELVDQLKKQSGIEVIGPSPSWRETFRGKFNWQIIVKAKGRSKLVKIAEGLPANWTFDLDPINLL